MYSISHSRSIFTLIQVGELGGSGGVGRKPLTGKNRHVTWRFGPEDLVKTFFSRIIFISFKKKIQHDHPLAEDRFLLGTISEAPPPPHYWRGCAFNHNLQTRRFLINRDIFLLLITVVIFFSIPLLKKITD